MQLTRTIGLSVAILLCLVTLTAHAQSNNGGALAGKPIIVYFPEFYHHESTHNGDTTFKYECYDDKDKMVNVDTVRNSNTINEIRFVKSFFDRRYGGGVGISPPYLTQKILEYNKIDKDTWVERNPAAKSTAELKGNTNKIVRSDTVANAAAGANQVIVRKYYKVTGVPSSGRAPVHED